MSSYWEKITRGAKAVGEKSGQRSLPTFDLPAYGATKAEALNKLASKGSRLTQRATVKMAIIFLDRPSRNDIERLFFKIWGKDNRIRINDICGRVDELMEDGEVKCVGHKIDVISRARVELLDIGKDERIRIHKQKTTKVAPPEKTSKWPWFLEGLLIGFLIRALFK